ncbi:HNH endonuclease [Streptomyces sp. NPDC004126]|uniref:HNH endonuclease signature motif containing protein n=1 Tax=Streptomyces sp. NPDC004126 TaxID=3390695 RepID=UPI003D027404
MSARTYHPRPSSTALIEAVAASVSLSGTLSLLGLPANGTLNERLKRWIREEGLSTSHFLGQAHQRGKPGTCPPRSADEILVKREDGRRAKTAQLRRALRDADVPERCADCGAPPEWLGLPMTLEVDHVNGDRSDNRLGNLRLLCPNCHAITSTWCRGGRRRSE